MKFKTNIKTVPEFEEMKQILQKKFPDATISMDEMNEDKVLHIHGLPEDSEHAAEVERNIEEAGFKGAWLERGVNNL